MSGYCRAVSFVLLILRVENVLKLVIRCRCVSKGTRKRNLADLAIVLSRVKQRTCKRTWQVSRNTFDKNLNIISNSLLILENILKFSGSFGNIQTFLIDISVFFNDFKTHTSGQVTAAWFHAGLKTSTWVVSLHKHIIRLLVRFRSGDERHGEEHRWIRRLYWISPCEQTNNTCGPRPISTEASGIQFIIKRFICSSSV